MNKGKKFFFMLNTRDDFVQAKPDITSNEIVLKVYGIIRRLRMFIILYFHEDNLKNKI